MISIVVAIYNIESLLHYCIDSILNQDDSNWELILVNDGSTDDSLTICRKYAELDSRISVVDKTNGGLSSARNAGILVAHGDWVMFIDGDDYILPNTISTLNKLIGLAYKDIDLVQYGYTEVAGYKSAVKIEGSISYDKITDREEMFNRLLSIGGEAASGCTKLIRHDLASKLLFKEGIIHEDEEFTTRLLFNINAVAYTEFRPYMYVRRSNSITTTSFNTKRLDIIHIMLDRIEMLRNSGLMDMAEKFRLKLIRSLNLLYLAASAVKDSDSCSIIIRELNCQLRNCNINQLGMSKTEQYKYMLTRIGFPMLKSEAIIRRWLNKQVRYE
ncbi:glycosyltransferase [uncultured Muribaculum sp.]|uniref:glycosyltransferase family 2 protein n=1 Tax=uncultured Muribaculum sp. TaxID=1918613 RepID=UPI00272F22FB|nr:glycosyltransferase [uncultured Muribaculum sp.]